MDLNENKKPENPNAFPIEKISQYGYGMTLRDYFASKAMGTILNHKYYDGQQKYELNANSGLYSYSIMGEDAPEEDIYEAKRNQLNQASYIAELSYLVADAMLKERIK